MRLQLVDRRVRERVELEALVAEPWLRLERLVASVGCPAWAVDVVLVDDADMVAMNARYRGGCGVTDILSFSYLEMAGVGDPQLARGCGNAPADLWIGGPGVALGEDDVVGEIILAPDFIVSRCLEQRWSVAEEFPLLVVHGCLHLLGWDHDEAAESTAMQACEALLLAAEGLPHPLRQRS